MYLMNDLKNCKRRGKKVVKTSGTTSKEGGIE